MASSNLCKQQGEQARSLQDSLFSIDSDVYTQEDWRMLYGYLGSLFIGLFLNLGLATVGHATLRARSAWTD